ncbi:glycoside hydrolase family 15 protein [Candidatus Nitronereus thalassa]|uniref:Glycoside hydrolase family 15 protein n=1 Tax=Candidatus Nitronereus thalassa TaxID=3020898 RepID=A0ABU3KCT3_9BACT|nr:glycoside hydrolase family 15 protein [Candidatus Nitronereus thalassa]MDT7044034.1 glycoside hydrolase family 15 protein [Candidatus Nitronereus thalassa]
MPYQPIENYGLIGNMRTTALVGMNGSIDWFCFPHFDSPSIFAAILDDHKGGRFQILPHTPNAKHKQFYWPDTNVLVTRFLSAQGVGQIIDFMPVGLKETDLGYHGIIRRVQAIRGSLRFKLVCVPSFNYARDPHTTTLTADGVCFEANGLSLRLGSTIPLQQEGTGVTAEFELQEGHELSFSLQEIERNSDCCVAVSQEQAEDLFHQTVAYWRRWLAKCTYRGRWREMVYRSALTLKMLTFEPTGAIVASPTCSLPEGIGGPRNWDYRYTWIRDAAFTLYGLLRIGFTAEAEKFMHWLEARCHELKPDGSLQIMYGIDGRHELPEITLDHLEGYRQSTPVRVGNGAYDQLQLDIYGELLDSVYLYNKYGSPISYDLWKHLRRLINWVCDNWQRPDEGVWEVRGGQQHFLYSKLMCWVALDRGLRLADKRSFPADRERWLKTRDTIYEEIMEKGWSHSRRAFVQRYGSETLDAANLMMPLVFFVSPTDPRMLNTLDAINQPPERGGLVANALVYRYNVNETEDGLDGEEGTFNICTFWLVEALTRAGRTDEARLMFEQMIGYANHLGLYAEETGHHGEGLGNFPQAFTHLALISAAFNLDRALGSKG